MVTLIENRAALEALLAKADPGRADRADTRPIQRATWTGEAWEGWCAGSLAVYQPTIKLDGQRRFNCTCQDKRDRAHEVGPCKHVISLARAGLQHLVVLEALEGSN